jgi:uncharacterized repeat protein (TIGR01451 family)
MNKEPDELKSTMRIPSVLKKFILRLLIPMAACMPGRFALAGGTAAGSNISSQATVTYFIGQVGRTQSSNIATAYVDEVIDVNVLWQDTDAVLINPGGNSAVLAFKVTNAGNGTESFALSGSSSFVSSGPTVTLVGLYPDANGNGLYDPGIDMPYIPGVNDPTLEADKSLSVFVLNSIPSGVSAGDRVSSRLTATSKTGTGAPASIFVAAGDGGTDAIVGNSSGSATVTGTYLVSDSVLLLNQEVQITDHAGGQNPVTGAIITYLVTVTVRGSGTAEKVIITDSIPANTTYQPGTLKLNSVSLSDAADGDAGDMGGTTPGVVTVGLGDLTMASPAQTISFCVLIN